MLDNALSLTRPSSVIKMLEALMSRWMMFLEWRYSRPCRRRSGIPFDRSAASYPEGLARDEGDDLLGDRLIEDLVQIVTGAAAAELHGNEELPALLPS